MALQEQLLAAGRTRWLDVGSGRSLSPAFEYVDLFPENLIPEPYRCKYHCLDIVNAPAEALRQLGQFHLVRLQHTLEHLSFEDGQRALLNCATLLGAGGYILISVPDLRVHIQAYLRDGYKDWPGYAGWAQQRIPLDAPPSAYFSVFAHSMTYEPHKWCYDYEGLAYQLGRTGKFAHVRELKPTDPLASYPFTHNRPEEDVCAIAQKA